MGFLNVGEKFGRMISRQYNTDFVVLELEIPTDKLNTLVRDREGRRSDDISYERGSMTDLQSLDEMKKEFSEEGFDNSVEAFRYYCQVVSNADGVAGAEGIQFGVRHAVPFKWVRGVWDEKEHEEPVFESLDNVIERLESRYPIKMPGSVSKEERKELIKEEIGNEFTHLLQMDKDAKKMLEIVNQIDNKLNQLSPPVSGSKSLSEKEAEALVDFLISELSGALDYNSYYERIRRNTKWMIDNSSSYSSSLSSFSLDDAPRIEYLDELIQEIDEIKDRLEKILQITDEDINEEVELAARNHWNLKDLEEKRDFREKIEEDLVEVVENLPNFEPLSAKLKNHKGQYVKRLS